MSPEIQTLAVRGITRRYGETHALRFEDADGIEFRAGEVHALVGENGAGKSTLVKIVSGLEQPSSGELLLGGVPYAPRSAVEARHEGVDIVLQESGLVQTMSVTDNLLLGREGEVSAIRVYSSRTAHRVARRMLERVGLDIDTRRTVDSFDLETQKFIEMARALSRNPRVLVIDEMTASLGVDGVMRLKALISELTAAGTLILYISHYFEEIFEICDRATVLRDGQLVETVEIADTDTEKLQTLMVGRSLIGEMYHEQQRVQHRPEPVLQLNAVVAGAGIQPLDLVVRRGEIVGLGGLVGCGIEKIAGAIFGRSRLSSGSIRLDGEPYSPSSPREAIAQGVAYVSPDRERNDLLIHASIQDNIVLPSLRWRTRFGFLGRRRDARDAAQVMDRLRVKAGSPLSTPAELSGGNRQKVVLGRWLLRESKLIVLHNPTRGVDVGAKADIYQLVRDLAADGVAVLLLSDELNELIGVADRVLIMRRGALTGEFTHEQGMTEEELVQCMV